MRATKAGTMQRALRTGLLGAVLGMAACGPKTTGLDEGTALAAQGKLDEAAAKLEGVCAQAPDAEACGQAERKASEAHVALARQQLERGEYLAAQRQLWLALARGGDEASRAPVRALLDGEELLQGVRFERAVTYLGETAAFTEVTAVAASSSPVAARARTWLDQHATARLTEAVREACGPARRGSCSQASEALMKANLKGPGVDDARALADDEQRRVYPLRREAETFLQLFAADAKKGKSLHDCLIKGMESGFALEEGANCRQQAFGDSDPGGAEGRYNARKTNENLWRKLLKNLDDPALVQSLNERKARAQSSGESDKLDIPKPPKKP